MKYVGANEGQININFIFTYINYSLSSGGFARVEFKMCRASFSFFSCIMIFYI